MTNPKNPTPSPTQPRRRNLAAVKNDTLRTTRKAKEPKQPDLDGETHTVLRFTPWAWAKLQFFCHHGDTEIGGFGVTSDDDLLLIEDFITVRQRTSSVSVAFDDDAVADFFEAQVDAGRRPEQFARYWCHTHPGHSPIPSSVDEETFHRVFGRCDWSVMFILARGGRTYARLRFAIGPTGDLLIPVTVDYSTQFRGSEHAAWEEEYNANILPIRDHRSMFGAADLGDRDWDWDALPFDHLDPTIEAELIQHFEDMAFNEDTLEDNEVVL